jgi:uncharacterized Zn finger protein
MKPVHIKQLQAKSQKLQVRRISKDTFVVASRTNPTSQHIVSVKGGRDANIHARCTCPWAHNGGVGCVHVMAVLHMLAAKKRRKLSFWGTLDEARRQRQRILRLGENTHDALYITSRNAGVKPRRAA